MKHNHLIGVAAVALAASVVGSCTMDPYLITPEEEYVRAFIKDFGLVDSEQDWNTAQSASVKIDLGTDQPDLVKVYARKGEKYYLVASLQGVTGNMDVPVDVPKGTTDVLVSVDGAYYMGKIDTPILCTGTPAKVKSRSVDLSRSTISEEERAFVYDPDNPAYEFSTTMSATGETYGIKVGIDPKKEYRYFNSRQIGPIIGHNTNDGNQNYTYYPWPSYWSLDTKEYVENTTDDKGLLPERGLPNAEMRTTDSRVIDDFVYVSNNGEFYITPLFYGSNLQHTLGVFLLDPETEQPLMAADGVTVIKFPIYENKHDDDIKVKALPYTPEPTSVDFAFSGEQGLYVNEYGNEVFLVIDGDDTDKSYIFNITAKDKNGNDITNDFIDDISLDNQYGSTIYDASKSGNTVTVTAKSIGDQWTKIMYKGNEIGSFHVFVDSKDTPRSFGIDKDNVADEYKHCIAEDGSIKLKKGETAVFPFKLYKFKKEWGEANGNEVTLPSTIKLSEILTKSGWHDSSYKLTVNDDSSIKIEVLDNPQEKNIWDCLFFDFQKLSNTYLYSETPYSNKICSLHIIIDDATAQAKKQEEKSRSSRADQSEWDKLTGPGGNLYHDENTLWENINKLYDAVGDLDVNSYLVTEQQLVRSRIYHVKLTYNGKPWTGKFGFYIDYKWLDSNEDWSIRSGARTKTGRHYSMRSLNTYYSTDKDYTASGNTLSEGTKFNYCYAATYRHPVSGIQIMSFEDMSNTHPGPKDMGIGIDGNVYSGYDYKKWSWIESDDLGDYSSDRDLNDLIFLVEGVDEVVTPPEDPTVEIVETGFNWYWAVEDLGSTDDFDFNDVVFKISSITQSRREQQVDDDGNPIVDEDKNPVWGNPEIMKCVKFTPQAAGGTMETYARWSYNGITYCLAPGVYYEDGLTFTSRETNKPLSALDASTISKDDACEIHKWFGVDNYNEMINTMSTSARHEAIGTCTIYFKPEFTLEGFGSHTNKEAIDGEGQGLSISIGSPSVELTTDEIDKDMAQKEYCVEKPEKGTPAQMFIINCDEWRWATERTHIKQAYPDFGRWVSNKNEAIEWYKNSTPGKIY